MNRELIFDYMEWDSSGDNIHRILNGNDMIDAMNKMAIKEDWEAFFYLAYKKVYFENDVLMHDALLLLMQPKQFFELMAEWLVA